MLKKAGLVFVALLATAIVFLARPLLTDSADASLALWDDVTPATLGITAEWSNKVELADINNDGRVDILFANGGDYDSPGIPVANRILLNDGAGKIFRNAGDKITGNARALTRVIRVRDVNRDGAADIFFGNTYQSQSQLYLGSGAGAFVNVSASHLPAMLLSVGDTEFGDVDNDGDLDMVIADWGVGNPMHNSGGRCRLWLNDGEGHFTDVSATQMPPVAVRFSWELELVDIDNDTDLDVLVSCKRCHNNFLFNNNGRGSFSDVSETTLPATLRIHNNNYDFEAMDIDGDGYLDLVTANDGFIFQERILINNRRGGFNDETARRLPLAANPPLCDDNMISFLDYDSDGDADFLVASLNCQDRLLVNDGGVMVLTGRVFSGTATRGTLGFALADLNGDQRLDVVQAQGETVMDDRVFFATHLLPDTAAPHISRLTAPSATTLVARVHDNKSPLLPQDLRSVTAYWELDGAPQHAAMQWYGEYLWRAVLPAGALATQLCASDAAGNRHCEKFP